MHATHHPPTVAAPATHTPPNLDPASLLRRAADYLATHGWVRCVYYSDAHSTTPAACASGAIAIAAYGHPHPEPHSHQPADYRGPADLHAWQAYLAAENLLENFLGLEHSDDPDEPESLFEWNDTEHRSADEVIAALRAAADSLTTTTTSVGRS